MILQTKYPIETLDKISNFGYRASVFSPFAREKDLLRKQFSSMSYSFDSPVQRQSGKIENKKRTRFVLGKEIVSTGRDGKKAGGIIKKNKTKKNTIKFIKRL